MPIATYLAETSSPGQAMSSDAVIAALSGALYPDGRRIGSVEVVRTQSMVADGAAIFLLDHDHVLFLSPAAHPDAAAIQAQATRTMAGLGPVMAERILPVTATGMLADRSFLILPRCEPLAGGRLRRLFQTPRVAATILGWLRQLVDGTIGDPPSRDGRETDEFRRSLRALVDMHDLPGSLRADAERLDAEMAAGTIRPRHVPMHGDLWRNNIMARPGSGDLVVIDWAGGTASGYAIYDLIRFHQSFNLSSDRLRRELLWYREALGGGAQGLSMIRAHLLGALGHYANRLGEFPRDRFVALARDCYGAVDSALAGLPRS